MGFWGGHYFLIFIYSLDRQREMTSRQLILRVVCAWVKNQKGGSRMPQRRGDKRLYKQKHSTGLGTEELLNKGDPDIARRHWGFNSRAHNEANVTVK